jgi:hypothetical protein
MLPLPRWKETQSQQLRMACVSLRPLHITLSLLCGDQKRQNTARVKYWKTALSIFALSASLALAEDFKTINGKIYKDATISRVETDGIVLRTKTGISKVYFIELPKDVQERFLPSPPPKTGTAQRGPIELKSWIAAMANPTSFVLLFVGGASLIAVVAFAIVRSRLQ